MDKQLAWTEERVERLRVLVRDGLTASQIAERLRCTGNAVIGKALRAGFKLGSNDSHTERRLCQLRQPRVSEEQRKQIASLNALGVSYLETASRLGLASTTVQRIAAELGLKRARQQGRPGAGGSTRPPPRPQAERPVLSTPERIAALFSEGYQGQKARVSLFELKDGMCKFPIDDPEVSAVRYCGDRAEEGGAYCAHHAARCYNETPPYKPSQVRRAFR